MGNALGSHPGASGLIFKIAVAETVERRLSEQHVNNEADRSVEDVDLVPRRNDETNRF